MYYDTTFEQRLLIFKAGSGGGFDIPAVQPDGTPSCAYGEASLEGSHLETSQRSAGCANAEDADYVVYESERFRTPYVAVKVRPSLQLNLEEEQLGFQLLRRLVDLQDEITAMPAGAARDTKERELAKSESFLEYLIELQVAYGISQF